MNRYARRRPTTRQYVGTRLVQDTSFTEIPARAWLGGSGRDVQSSAERRAEELLQTNRTTLTDMGIEAHVGRVRGEPVIQVNTSSRVGAIPLRSPMTGRADFGLVIQPRFEWTGVGDLLASTGFRVLPELLPLQDLPRSERHIPPWVLASVVLHRLKRLLAATSRRFTVVEEDRLAPRGAVNWGTYAVERFPTGRALSVPCRYPDLRDDEELRAAIHFTVRRQRESLLAASHGGVVVRRLIALCEELIARLSGTPPKPPSRAVSQGWQRRDMASRTFIEGVEAIGWTMEERGLAGLSDLSGLSWRLDMDQFFEAWVETIGGWAAERVGAQMLSARNELTRVPLDWKPRYAGSQRSLIPDVVIEKSGETVIVLDAKYKQHAEEIQRLGWANTSDVLRERHRADLLQVLAYSTIFEAKRIISLLVYPCATSEWNELHRRGRTLSIARLLTGPRHVEVGLLAVPLGGPVTAPGELISRLFVQ